MMNRIGKLSIWMPPELVFCVQTMVSKAERTQNQKTAQQGPHSLTQLTQSSYPTRTVATEDDGYHEL